MASISGKMAAITKAISSKAYAMVSVFGRKTINHTVKAIEVIICLIKSQVMGYTYGTKVITTRGTSTMISNTGWESFIKTTCLFILGCGKTERRHLTSTKRKVCMTGP
jgi:hypothetical protein